MTESSTTPWYPGMRLFRQRWRGDWSTTIDDLAQALVMHVELRQNDAVPACPGSSLEIVDAPSLAPAAQLSRLRETAHGTQQYRADDSLVACSIEIYGEYLQGQVEILGLMVTPGATVVDWRPGQTLHALAAATLVGAQGRVLVHEPDNFEQQLVAQNVLLNGCDNVDVIRNVDGGTQRGADLRIDDLCINRLDVLKLGFAASEPATVSGASATLWRCRPRVLANCANAEDATRLAETLQEHGYRCFSTEVPYFRCDNFNRSPVDHTGNAACLTLLGLPEESGVSPPEPWEWVVT